MNLPVADLLAAWNSHAWLLFSAIIIGSVVAIVKQGWLGTWIAAHLPPASRPYLAMALGAITSFAAGIQAHQTVVQAILQAVNGVIAGALAVAGHQVVIEGMRGGKEFIPKAPPLEPPTDKGA